MANMTKVDIDALRKRVSRWHNYAVDIAALDEEICALNDRRKEATNQRFKLGEVIRTGTWPKMEDGSYCAISIDGKIIAIRVKNNAIDQFNTYLVERGSS